MAGETDPSPRAGSAPATSTRALATAELLKQAHASDNEGERHDLLDQVVVLNIPVAVAVAARYRSRGVPQEDLRQVACLALTKSVQRFDPGRAGEDFLSFAVPTIRGEVRRYFRDQGWAVRPTRRMQELQAAVFAVVDELQADLGRSPRAPELAERLDEPLEAVLEALTLEGCFQPSSLDVPIGSDGITTMGEMLTADGDGWDAADARVLLGTAVRNLSDRDRRILFLRFFEGRSQREIAEDIGVTQMQVSRLLSRIMRDMREEVGQPVG